MPNIIVNTFNMSASWETRIGVQTIVWGRSLRDQFADIVRTIRSLGIHGIEVFQQPGFLPTPEEFEKLLGNDITLLGLAGGNIEDRVNFAKNLKQKPLFIYSQSVQQQELDVMANGFTIGLHPHQYSSVSTFAAARRVATQHLGKPIEIIYDTAHSFLAGENVLKVLQDHGDCIRYVHLKDWTPHYGSSFFSYARGFCAAGEGIALQDPNLRRELIKWLSQREDRWLIIEQDWVEQSIERHLRKSLDWIFGKVASLPSVISKPQKTTSRANDLRSLDNAQQVMLLEFKAQMLSSVQRPTLSIYKLALDHLGEFARCKYATVWEVNSASEHAVLRATYVPVGSILANPEVQQLAIRQSLSWIAVENGAPLICSDVRTTKDGGRTFQDQGIAEQLKLKGMIVLPIFNSYNQNQPELIICLFPQVLHVSLSLLGLGEVTKELHTAVSTSHLIDCVTSSLSVAIESSWHYTTTSLANAIDWHAAQSKSSDEFLSRVAEVTVNALACGSVEIFWLNTSGTLSVLYPKPKKPQTITSTTPTWHWSVVSRGQNEEETIDGRGPLIGGRVLASPLYAQSIPISSVVGMIACFDKKTPEGELPIGLFSMTDLALLDSIQSAIALHLVRMMEDEAYVRQMRRIVHELREPLTIFRGASSAAIAEMKKQNWVFPGKDHLQVFRRYLGTMEQTAAMIGFAQSDFQVTLQRSRCLLFEQVIQPALDDLEVLLSNHKLTRDQIDISRALGGDALYLDAFRMRQVVFNLLVNAVKYTKRKNNGEVDPELFRVEIEGRSSGAKSLLIVRDFGIGIPRDYEEAIFNEGVRAPNAVGTGVVGDGLGLHIVKQILLAHEATIRVTHEADYAGLHTPATVMVIEFPAKLKEPAYKQPLQADISQTSNKLSL